MLPTPKSAIPTARSSSSMNGIDVPAAWSQVAADVLAQKYFRRAGVPRRLTKVAEDGVPEWLWRSAPDEAALAELPTDALRRRDRARGRCSTAWPAAGPTGAGRAATSTARPTPAPSTTRSATCWRRRWPRPNCRSGSTPACTGPTASTARPQGHYYVDPRDGEVDALRPRPTSGRSRTPASSSRVNDDLVNEGGIMDLWVREARIFKYGSGTGSNFSNLRGEGEPLSGGGKSSRPDELPQDRRPRRRRHQVGRHHAPRGQDGRARSRPSRHRGVRQLEGASRSRRSPPWSPARKLLNRHLNAIMQACHDWPTATSASTRKQNADAAQRDRRRPRRPSCPRTTSSASSSSRGRATRHIEVDEYDTDWKSKAYFTVSGQNGNNSVRVTNDFMQAVEARTATGR